MKKHLEARRYLAPFSSGELTHRFSDVLVIGGGVAGLRAAIAAAGFGKVVVLAKQNIEESNTAYAQGGVAAVLHDADSIDLHVRDTLEIGQGLCDEAMVRTVVSEGPARIRELIEWGAEFDRSDGRLMFTKEGGHSVARIIHARGDQTGIEIARTLIETARATPDIKLIENHFALDLITHEGRVVGALVWHPEHGMMMSWASRVILATGGIGRLYRETTNPPLATGDGLAMAYRAGAALSDLEFVQFHPTTLYVAGASRALISETVRGEGAKLLNRNRERFMPKYDAAAELAPRDVVSRAIITEMQRSNYPCVFLDVTHLGRDRLKSRFPMIYDLCESFDIDISTDLIPVRPSAHYFIGGVKVDDLGRTSVRNLYAVGEVACSGLHGANRMGSNSLLEGLVFGARAGLHAGRDFAGSGETAERCEIFSNAVEARRGELDIVDVEASLRSLMGRAAGIEREESHLETAEDYIDFWCGYVLDKTFADVRGWVMQNMLTVAKLIVHSARQRRESRGVHYRSDYPGRNDAEWKKHIIVQRG